MTENKWFTRSFRRNLVDMHIADWDDTFLSQFDPEEYLECLRLGNIKSAMIYLQSHTGLCNRKTESGKTHRAFINDNKIKTLIDLCHKNSIDVIAYYSLIYNNYAYDCHPEWRMLDIDGNSTRNEKAPSKWVAAVDTGLSVRLTKITEIL